MNNDTAIQTNFNLELMVWYQPQKMDLEIPENKIKKRIKDGYYEAGYYFG